MPQEPAPDPLDAAMAQAYAPPSTRPLSPCGSVLRSISSALPQPITQVHLREPEEEAPAPVVRPLPAGQSAAAEVKGQAGRYQIAGEIARGGMGSILRGRDTDLGRDLALKVLLELHRQRPELVQRFVEEAQITGQLQHPGIPPVYELGQLADQRPYFTMKLVKGRTLLALLSARKSCQDERPRFVAVFAQLAQTLAYAHARGVIHRDLKPSNVMVGAFGEVQVMDWGLAKVLGEGGVADEKKAREKRADVSVIRTARSTGSAGTGSKGTDTEAGSVLGTPAYMPPEQARGDIDRLDERADVFGLGAILCEILTGKPPYEGDDSSILCSMAVRGDLDAAYARLEASGADPELVALARRCLAADRKDRPADAGVVAEEVTAYLRSVEARLRQAELDGVAARTRALEERKRRRLTVALAVTILLVAASGTGVWLRIRSKHEAQVANGTGAAREALGDAAGLVEKARTAPAGDVSRWDLARKRLDLAWALVSNGLVERGVASKVEEARASLDEEARDARLLAALVHASAAQIGTYAAETHPERDRALPLYREAFRAYGLPPGEIAAEVAARRIRERRDEVRAEIVAGLDEWVRAAINNAGEAPEPSLEWVKAVAREADSDPWRSRAREAMGRRDRAALEALADGEEARKQPPLELSVVATSLFSLGGKESAVKLLLDSHVKHPSNFALNHTLAFLLWRMGKERGAEAVRYASVAVALQPESARARRILGNALGLAGDREGALREVRKALDLEPGFAVAWQDLGCHLLDQGKTEDSLAVFRRSIELAPESGCQWRNFGSALRKMGKKDEGNEALRRSVELSPGDEDHLSALSSALVEDGRSEEAVGVLKKALELKPDSGGLYFELGGILHRLRDLAGARAAYRKSLEVRPDSGGSHHDLAHVLKDAGDLEAAIAEHRLAVERRPKTARYRTCLADALQEQGKLAPAEAEHRKAVDLEPNSALAWNGLAWFLTLIGKLDEAVPAARKAVQLDPTSSTIADTLGQALVRRGDLEEGAATLREALRLDSPLDESRARLLDVLFRQGKHAGVVLECAEAIDRAPAGNQDLLRALLRSSTDGPPAPELSAALGKLLEAIDRAAAARKHRPDLATLRIAAEAARVQGIERLWLLEEAEDLEASAPPLHSWLGLLRRKALPDLPTFASIDAALDGEDLALESDSWRWFPGTAEPSPSLEWTRTDFDDSGWKEGPGGFSYLLNGRTPLEDMQGRTTTLYLRRRIRIPSTEACSRLVVSVLSDDGFVAYLNGEEVGRFRAGAPGTRLGHDAVSSEGHPPDSVDVFEAPIRLLKEGENLIALQGLNDKLQSAGFCLSPEVRVEFKRDAAKTRVRLAGFLTAARGADAPARVAYLEGLLLQMEGKPAEALERLETAARSSPREPRPLLRVVECLEGLGKGAEAAERLRAAVPSLERLDRKLLDRWIAAEKAAGREPEENSAGWPRKAPPRNAR